VREFGELVERHRRELRVHCYRMLGSFDEAEDLVQETFLRAWKNLDRFEGRSSPRAWLYRIATNACLDVLDGRARRLLPYHPNGPSTPDTAGPRRTDIPWLQPFPDRLLEPASSETWPDSAAVAQGDDRAGFPRRAPAPAAQAASRADPGRRARLAGQADR
jgi:RNA polymerase sigma-70 factor, ECF subfamily